MTPISIRDLRTGDIDQIVRIAGALVDAPHWPPSAYATILGPAGAPRRVAFVAQMAPGQIAGFAVASLIPPEAELETIAVDPCQQRRGIGRRLLLAVAEESARQGCKSLFLEVRASNMPAQALYRAAGFELTGNRPRYYTAPEEDALLFRLNSQSIYEQGKVY